MHGSSGAVPSKPHDAESHIIAAAPQALCSEVEMEPHQSKTCTSPSPHCTRSCTCLMSRSVNADKATRDHGGDQGLMEGAAGVHCTRLLNHDAASLDAFHLLCWAHVEAPSTNLLWHSPFLNILQSSSVCMSFSTLLAMCN